MAAWSERFEACKTLEDLGHWMRFDPNQWRLLSTVPQYAEFTLAKPRGGYRLIESPAAPLKKALRRLKVPLQCVYYFGKSDIAHGYILHPRKDSDVRGVQSNAAAHRGANYMLNIDLKGFFHQITVDRVREIFRSRPLRFDARAAQDLARLVTYKGRLPMGSPTSPVLSNFACRTFDEDASRWADMQGVRLTRFVDDITISSQRELGLGHLNEFADICRAHGFSINQEKLKVLGPEDEKIVTGIAVGDKLTMPAEFRFQLEEDIRSLRLLVRAERRVSGGKESPMLSQFVRQVKGKLAFARLIDQTEATFLDNLETSMAAMLADRLEPVVMDWDSLPYWMEG